MILLSFYAWCLFSKTIILETRLTETTLVSTRTELSEAHYICRWFLRTNQFNINGKEYLCKRAQAECSDGFNLSPICHKIAPSPRWGQSVWKKKAAQDANPKNPKPIQEKPHFIIKVKKEQHLRHLSNQKTWDN